MISTWSQTGAVRRTHRRLSASGKRCNRDCSIAADIGAGDRKDLGAVDGAHHLTAPGRHAGAQKQPVELDALVPKRVAFVDAYDSRNEALDIVDSGEEGPSQRIARLELGDAVAHRAPVVVKVQQDSVVLGRRREIGAGPRACDVRTEGEEPGDQAELAFSIEAQSGRQGEVPAAALAGYHDPGAVDTEAAGVGRQPFETGHAIIETSRIGRYLGNR